MAISLKRREEAGKVMYDDDDVGEDASQRGGD
jgi:hypothetical protein